MICMHLCTKIQLNIMYEKFEKYALKNKEMWTNKKFNKYIKMNLIINR